MDSTSSCITKLILLPSPAFTVPGVADVVDAGAIEVSDGLPMIADCGCAEVVEDCCPTIPRVLEFVPEAATVEF